MRDAGFVLSLAARRLGRREGGSLVAALGIAAAAGVLAVILAGTTVAQDRALAQDVDRLPAEGRSVRAVWFGVPAGAQDAWPTLDRQARSALEPLPVGEPTPIVLVREATIGGQFVGLAAVDGLAPHVLLRSGRLPRPCTPERCEVLRLRGEGRLPNVLGLRIVEVGTARLRSRQLFGDFLVPTDNALADAAVAPALQRSSRYHRPAPPPLVVAEGVGGLVSSPVLARNYRSYAWVQPLSEGTPRLWEVDRLVDEADRARATLAASSPAWSLTLPVQELEASQHDASVAGRRLLLVGGEAAALLVAFAVLAAGTLRRDLAAARRRLTWHGARLWQRVLLSATESAAVGLGGAIVGWLLGIAGAAVVAASADAPVVDVLTESVVSPSGILLGLGMAVLAACVLGAAVSVGEGRGRFGPLEAAAVAAALAAVAVVASGAADPDELATSGTAAAVLLVLPGLVAFAAAVAASRVLPAAGRALARRGGRRVVRLAGVSLARSPGAARTTAAFLALAVALAVLAEAYRSTLSTGERDQAAFAVPADVVVREDLRALVPVLRAAPLERYRAIPGVEAVHRVSRLTASAGPAASVSGVTVLGVEPPALESMPVWRSSWGVSRQELVETIRREGDDTLRGPTLHGRSLVVSVGPGIVSYRAVVLEPGGAFRTLELGAARAHSPTTLRARLPRSAVGGRLVRLVVVPPRIIERGSDGGVALRGTTTIAVQGVSLRDWIGTGGLRLSGDASSDTATVRFTITPQREAVLRPRQPTDDDPPRAAVTPALASLAGGLGGRLPLVIGDEPVVVTVGAVVDRLPGTTGDAVVADVDALATAIDASSPGAAPVDELWLDAAAGREDDVAAALARKPFVALDTVSRAAVEADARRDPLGHGTLLALAAAALAALVLAVWGLVLAIRADVRDDRGDLVDLESQGATTRLLRRVVVARAVVVAAVGGAAGIVTGALLAVLVTRVISVTARAQRPEPPLVTTVDSAVLVLAAVAFAAAAACFVALSTRRAFSDPRGPGRIGAEP